MILRVLIFLIFYCSVDYHLLAAQPKYQSLMWRISGNGLEQSSYLYGTMHISGKVVFHLGEPFYKAIGEVDVVALELEPEEWLDAVMNDPEYQFYLESSGLGEDEALFYQDESPLPALKGYYKIGTDLHGSIVSALSYSPAVLNYLLFRYGEHGAEADFEEDTWLDMYIYQVGKKKGKTTIGLETYAQSDYYMKMASRAGMDDNEEREYDTKNFQQLVDIQNQFEPAYRRGDLDLIDSLNRISSSEGFQKYILVERNRVFVNNIDSLLKSGKSVFAGMGCAHLPGKEGIIEMLRNLGYDVSPVNKGERDARQREKLDKTIFRRQYTQFVTEADDISFSTPARLYHLGADKNTNSWLSMDMANGGSFTVSRIKTYAGLSGRTQASIMLSVDSVLFEAIAGDIVSLRHTDINGNPALDVINVNRRGDAQRRLIIILPEEIVVMKVTATGDKVKLGYGNEFFNSLKISQSNKLWNASFKHQSLNIKMPGQLLYYPAKENHDVPADLHIHSYVRDKGEVFVVQKHTIEDPGFLDEDIYELNRLANAYARDNGLIQTDSKMHSQGGLPALNLTYDDKSGKKVFVRFVIQNLSYYAFAAYTQSELTATNFFNGINLSQSQPSDFIEYQDTVSHFKVKIPYLPGPPNTQEDNQYNRIFKNMFKGTNEISYLRPPDSDQSVRIAFQRFHRFSDGENKESFFTEKQEAVSAYGMELLRKNIEWNDKGCIMNFVVADTATVRRYMHKYVLHNKSLYALTASFDSVSGPGEFVTTAFETFQPTDTVFPYYHFRNMDGEYLDALMSSDSATRSDALDLAGEMDFSLEGAGAMRKAIRNFPVIESEKDAEFLRSKIIRGLGSDTTSENIAFLCNEFYLFPDSSGYQLELLNALLSMKTDWAWNAYRKLLLDEPPVITDRNGETGIGMLEDSLKLAMKIIPDLIQLLTLEEYQAEVYHLLAASLEKDFIKADLYKDQLNQILIEARTELKKLNVLSEDAINFNTDMLLDLCSLLHPYRGNPEVESFFKKAGRTKRMRLQLDLLKFDLENKLPVQDSVVMRIAANSAHIIPLCRLLTTYDQLSMLPEKYRSREELLKVYISEKYRSGRGIRESVVDTVVVVSHQERVLRGQVLDVYFCKLKKQRSRQWLGAVVAFNASDPEVLWPGFIDSSGTVVLDRNEDELEELEELYELVEAENRKFIGFKYGVENVNFEWY